jgi:putative ABC transport system permease protein
MYTPNLPAGYATLTQDPVAAGNQPEPVPTDQLDRAARQVLPVSGTAAVSTTACPAGLDAVTCTLWPDLPKEQLCPYEYGQNPPAELRERLLHDPRCDVGGPWVTTTSLNGVVDDGSALALLTAASGDDLARAAQTLRDGGVVVADRRMVKDGTVTLTAFTGRKSGESDERKVTVAGYALAHPISRDLVVLSPGAVTRAGYRTAPLGIVIATSRVPTDAERGAFRAAAGALGAGYFGAVERPLELNEDLTLLVLSIAAGVIALGAAAIATGLAAVDGRGDLATLAAVGASPGLRRRLSLSQSGVIAGLGSLLGAGAGLGAGLAVLAAYNRALGQNWPPELPYPIAVPWSSLLIAVLVVPAAAMLGAGLLTRSRLPIERRL